MQGGSSICRHGLALRDLHAVGISIYQVEPYLEHLVAIHEFFSSGGAPMNPGDELQAIYEKLAAGVRR